MTDVGIVVIGRNEGARLSACLASLPHNVPVAYVDSASSDDSVARARQAGVQVVAMRAGEPLGAGRARNRGFDALIAAHPGLAFVQMIDGDCVIDPDWIDRAREAFAARPQVAALFGRRRERFPERSIYNALCDDEWDVTPGIVQACGGDAMFRVNAFRQVAGFNTGLIAGEEPDLCLRLAKVGWHVACIAAEMTRHDADITRFSQWWRRAKRGGFAYAEHVAVHRGQAFPNWTRQVVSIVAWGVVMPVVLIAVIAALPTGWRLPGLGVAAAVLALQVLRVAWRKWREGVSIRFALAYGWFMFIAKFAQASGIMSYGWRSVTRRRPSLIEYKAVA